MLARDQDVSDCPSWDWPYASFARLARADRRVPVAHLAALKIPRIVTTRRLGALVAVATGKRSADNVEDETMCGELMAGIALTCAADTKIRIKSG